jgi:hypothetical protein
MKQTLSSPGSNGDWTRRLGSGSVDFAETTVAHSSSLPAMTEIMVDARLRL